MVRWEVLSEVKFLFGIYFFFLLLVGSRVRKGNEFEDSCLVFVLKDIVSVKCV